MQECFGCHGNKTVLSYICRVVFSPVRVTNVARVHVVLGCDRCSSRRHFVDLVDDLCPAWGRTPCCEEARAQAVLTSSWDVDIVELRKWRTSRRKKRAFILILLKLLYFLKCFHRRMPKAEIWDQSFPLPFLILKNARVSKEKSRCKSEKKSEQKFKKKKERFSEKAEWNNIRTTRPSSVNRLKNLFTFHEALISRILANVKDHFFSFN